MSEVIRVVEVLEVDAEDQHYGWKVGSVALVTEEDEHTVYACNPEDDSCSSWLDKSVVKDATHVIITRGAVYGPELKESIEDEIDNNPEVSLEDIAEEHGVYIVPVSDLTKTYERLTYIPLTLEEEDNKEPLHFPMLFGFAVLYRGQHFLDKNMQMYGVPVDTKTLVNDKDWVIRYILEPAKLSYDPEHLQLVQVNIGATVKDADLPRTIKSVKQGGRQDG